MLHILLWILKIVGILLAVLLGILLFGLICVLFVPVRYRIEAEGKAGGKHPIHAEVKVSWLLHIISAAFTYREAARIRIKIFCFTIFDSAKSRKSEKSEKAEKSEKKKPGEKKDKKKREKKQDTEREKKQEKKQKQGTERETKQDIKREKGNKPEQKLELEQKNKPEQKPEPELEQKNKPEQKPEPELEQKNKPEQKPGPELEQEKKPGLYSERENDKTAEDTGKNLQPEAAGLPAGNPADINETAVSGNKTAAEKKAPAKTENIIKEGIGEAGESKHTEQEEAEGAGDGEDSKGKIRAFFRTLRHFFERLLAALKNIEYTIKKICDKIKKVMENIQYYTEVLKSEAFRGAWEVSKRQLLRILRVLRPKTCSIHLLAGTGDPAGTGQLLAFYGILYPFIGNYVSVEADFENKVMEGSLFIRGRITMFVFLTAAFQLFVNKNIRRLLKMVKKEDM